MKAVVQRVVNARVTVGDAVVGSIGAGLLVYLGVAGEDTEKDAEWMAEKVVNLRIFVDSQECMNLSLLDILKQGGVVDSGSAAILTISQFTLLGDALKGRRPYFGEAAGPEKAKFLYEYFVRLIKTKGLVSETGVFRAHMDVTYTNDGPVTIILNSRDAIPSGLSHE